MWTKRKIIEMAFEEIGLASYVFDLQPEDLQSALTKLDAMMAEWSGDGVQVGYMLTEDADLDTPSGIGDMDNAAVYVNLAVRIASSRGKIITPDITARARQSYRKIRRRTSKIIQRQVDNTIVPAGAGYRSNYHYTLNNPVAANPFNEEDIK